MTWIDACIVAAALCWIKASMHSRFRKVWLELDETEDRLCALDRKPKKL